VTTLRLAEVLTAAAVALVLGGAPSFAADTSAGVIVGVTGKVTVQRDAQAPVAATLGMRLEAVDVVVVERGAAAEIYLKGGGVVRLHDATRFEMPKAANAQAGASARLNGGSIAQLESGLWVLNDPKGSLLVSPMRGDDAEAVLPLTPRYETLAEPRATFLWSGGPAKAIVVVAKRREVVWKSGPASPGAPLDPGAALPLTAGEVYTWWLEPEAGGPPLTAGVTFRVAAADVIARTKAVEDELRSLAASNGESTAADYLRLAHYTGAGSWTRVLQLASKLPPGEAKTRAIEAATAGLRLDSLAASRLASAN